MSVLQVQAEWTAIVEMVRNLHVLCKCYIKQPSFDYTWIWIGVSQFAVVPVPVTWSCITLPNFFRINLFWFAPIKAKLTQKLTLGNQVLSIFYIVQAIWNAIIVIGNLGLFTPKDCNGCPNFVVCDQSGTLRSRRSLQAWYIRWVSEIHTSYFNQGACNKIIKRVSHLMQNVTYACACRF